MRSTPPGPTTTPGITPVKLARVSEQTAPGHRDRSETSGDEASAADRLRHGSSFGAAAAAYAEHRPGYAEAAVRWALEPVGDPQPAGVRVADVGAGTGKLTATLVSLGAEVTAVEPDPQMLAELRRAMPAEIGRAHV